MTQSRNAVHLAFSPSSQRALLLHGLSWIGGLSLLGGGVGLAQTINSEAITVPSAEDLFSTPAAAPMVFDRALPIAPSAPAEPRVRRSAAVQPERVQPEAVRSETARPEAVRPDTLSRPSDRPTSPSRPTPPLRIESATPVHPPSPQQIEAIQPAPAGDPSIDTTDYSVGATRNGEPPSSVVLSERSTGCRLILQQGQQVPASVCATRRTPVAVQQRRPAGNYSTLSRPTNASVNVGPVRVGVSGFSVGSTTPSGRDYYNRTLRPAGRLGNGNVALTFPLSIPAAITSAFGWRVHPITGDRRFHSGTDIGAPLGTPVLAAFAGQVAIADLMRGYGLTVVLQHSIQQRTAADRPATRSSTEETLYAHMSELFVQPGEWVEQGQVIGRVGSTGNSTGPHLHFEFREQTQQGWQALDPGLMLEYSLAQLVQSLQTAQANPEPFPKQSGFSQAIAATAQTVSSNQAREINQAGEMASR